MNPHGALGQRKSSESPRNKSNKAPKSSVLPLALNKAPGKYPVCSYKEFVKDELRAKQVALRLAGAWWFWGFGFIAALVCLYQFENWRGHRAWNRYVATAKAKGLHLDLQECIPPQVPDEENFTMTPVLAEVYRSATNTSGNPASSLQNVVGAIESNRMDWSVGNWNEGIPVSLLKCLTNGLNSPEPKPSRMSEAMRKRFGLPPTSPEEFARAKAIKANEPVLMAKYAKMEPQEQAQVVLAALAPMEPVWAELGAARKRPYCRYLMPQYGYEATYALSGLIVRLAPFLRLSAICHLELRQNEAALSDLELGFFLANSLKSCANGLSMQIRLKMENRLTQAIWEGTSRHLWTANELERLQKLLPLTNLIAEARLELLQQRAWNLRSIDLGIKNPNCEWPSIRDTSWDSYLDSAGYFLFFRLGPQGWFDLEKINLCRRYDDFLPKLMDVSSGRLNFRDMPVYQAFWNSPEAKYPRLNHVYFTCSASLLDVAAGNAAKQQASADFAYLGCALERYWLAKGTYPQRLEDLVPEYAEKIPNDILTGEPYHFRWEDKDHYLLYSVGSDRIDNGGRASRWFLYFNVDGDWIWRGGTNKTPPQ